MNFWKTPDVPHKGWCCSGMIDLRENDPEAELEICEMCGKDGIRYVHIMEHSEYPKIVRAGCVCAAKMENDYVAPKQRERKLMNQHSRRMTFLNKKWEHRQNGNYVMKFKGVYLTIMQSKYNKNHYGIVHDGKYVWNYKGRKICDLHTAKLAAFDLYDSSI